MLLVGLAVLLGAVGVLFVAQQPPEEDTDGLSLTIDDEARMHSPRAGRPPGLEGGAEGASASTPGDDNEPVAAPKSGPAEVLVLSADTGAPLAGVRVTEADGAMLGITDDDGLVDLADVPPDGVEVRATRDGFREASAHVRPRRRTVVELMPGITVSGRIVRAGADGDPGVAKVFVFDVDRREQIAAFATDATGRFEIDGVRPNHPFLTVVELEDLVPQTVRLLADAATTDLEVVVGAGARLSGRVLDAQGRPWPDVEVRLLPKGGLLFENHRSPSDVTPGERARIAAATPVTRTDAHGRYAFAGIPLHWTFEAVAVLAPRCEARSGAQRFEASEARRELDIRAPEEASLRIRVEDEDRAVVAGVTLIIDAAGGRWTIQSEDERTDGALLLRHLTPSNVTVTAARPSAPTRSETVELIEGREAKVTIVLPNGTVVRGRVLDKRGNVIANARVSWAGSDEEDRVEVRSGESGKFELSGITSPTGTLRISAHDELHGRFGFETLVFEDFVPGGRPLEVMLKDGTRVDGVFKQLPEGAQVVGGLLGTDERRLDLDADLRFVCRGAPARKSGIFVFRTRGLPPLFRSERVPFRSEERRYLGVLEFLPTNPRKGRVLDEHGDPVWGAKVTVQQRWSVAARRTDRQGHFEFENLPPARVLIRIVAEGYPPSLGMLGTHSEFERADYQIRPDVQVRFRILGERAEPLGRADVSVATMGAEPKLVGRRRTDREGNVHWWLRPGRYRVSTKVLSTTGTKRSSEEVVEVTTDHYVQDVELRIR